MAHLLIVDDEEAIVYMFKRFFELSGFRISTTQDPYEALEIAKNEPINGVITDFRMPAMNGSELLTRIRQFRPDLPAVIVSAYTGEILPDLGQRTRILAKPVEMKKLLNTMQQLMNEKT